VSDDAEELSNGDGYETLLEIFRATLRGAGMTEAVVETLEEDFRVRITTQAIREFSATFKHSARRPTT
jgi:hypothetical protein